MSSTETSAPQGPAPGTITWIEIPVLDLARAQKFYGSLFGWEFTPMKTGVPDPAAGQPANADYVLFSKGATHGGLFKLTEDCHITPASTSAGKTKSWGGVCVTISVESVDETLKLIEEAGGEAFKPKWVIPDNMGCAAQFLDSEKNVIGLWSMT